MQGFATMLKHSELESSTLMAGQRGWQQLASKLASPEPDPVLVSFLYEPVPPAPQPALPGYSALLRVQFRFLRRNLYLWILPVLSFFIVLVLSSVCKGFSLRYPQTFNLIMHGLAFLSPLFGGFCIAGLFPPEESGAFCIERTTNTSAVLLLLLRLLIGYGYSLLVTLLGTLLFLPFVPGLSLSWIIAELLIPLSFLASLCLFTTFLANSWIAIGCTSVCWFLRVTGSIAPASWLTGYEAFWHRPEILLPCTAILCIGALLAFQRRCEMRLSSPNQINLSL
jgi:hypothetical protein